VVVLPLDFFLDCPRTHGASPALLPRAVRRAVDDDIETPDELGDLYTTPTNRQVVAYLLERSRRWIRARSNAIGPD
jgi:hypothetical protein